MNTVEFLVERLAKARGWTRDLIADIDPSRWFDLPPGGVGHVAWQLGHIASSQVVLVHMRCFGLPYTDILPDSFRVHFGRGSTPRGGPAGYPVAAEIRDLFERVYEDSTGRIRALAAADLDTPATGEPHPLFATKGGAIATAAMHETFHGGQIAFIRRIMGKAPLR